MVAYTSGTTDYHLFWGWKGVDYDEGFYTVHGTCYVYTDCNCLYYNGKFFGYLAAKNNPIGFPVIGYDTWWDATNYNTPQYTACTSGACAKTGVVATFSTYVARFVGYDTFYC